MQLFFQQLRALLYKNFLLAKRSWKISLARLLFPAAFIFAFYVLVYYVTRPAPPITNTPVNYIKSIPKCVAGISGTCTTLVFGPNTTLMRDLMTIIGNNNDPPLLLDQDLVPTDMNYSVFANHSFYIAPNTTQGGIFQNPNLYQFEYTIVYNSTDFYPEQNDLLINGGGDNGIEETNFVAEMQLAMENAILRYQLGPEVNMSIALQSWLPFLDSQDQQFTNTIVGTMAMVFIYLGLTINIIVSLVFVVSEKEKNLRSYLRSFGQYESAYWLSWIIEQLTFYILSILIMLLLGRILPGLTYFRNSSFGVNFVFFLVYGIELMCLAFLLSSIISKTKAANISGFAIYFVGLGIVLTAAMMQSVVFDLWDPQVIKQGGNLNWPKILIWFPPFSFAKIIVDITLKSVGIPTYGDGYSDGSSSSQAMTLGYSWSDLSQDPLSGTSKDWEKENKFTVPSSANTLMTMLLFSALYMLVAWYLEYVITDSAGARRKVWFPFTAGFWGFSKKTPYSKPIPAPPLDSQFGTDEDVKAEAVKVTDPNSKMALKIAFMSKFFKGVRAVADMFLCSESGNVLALLGHNGAGKTTLINILTGLTTPSTGDAFIFGYSVREDMDEVRGLIGICPQFDIFWPDLTAREHLHIFLRMKHHFKSEEGESDINHKLHDVRLFKVGDHQVSTYSGGMRRRLSVALAMVGDPKVIILDEPTTGIDPANRRHIWQMIKEIKKDKLVLLTTHSMEEADRLGDRIAIMANGRLHCVGTSLHLKHKFGGGYRINFIADIERIPDLELLMRNHLPEAQLTNKNAGNLVFMLPDKYDEEKVGKFFSLLRNMPNRPVRDWGISNTTLEDVFLRVTANVHNY